MNYESAQPLPPYGRLISVGMTAASAFGLIINHDTIASQNVGGLRILALGPIAFFIELPSVPATSIQVHPFLLDDFEHAGGEYFRFPLRACDQERDDCNRHDN